MVIDQKSFNQEKIDWQHHFPAKLPPLVSLGRIELEHNLVSIVEKFHHTTQKNIKSENLAVDRQYLRRSDNWYKLTERIVKQIAAWTRSVAQQSEPIVLELGGEDPLLAKIFAAEGLTTICVNPASKLLADLAVQANMQKVATGIWKDKPGQHYFVEGDAAAVAAVFALETGQNLQYFLKQRRDLLKKLTRTMEWHDFIPRFLRHRVKQKACDIHNELLKTDDLIDKARFNALKRQERESPISLIFCPYLVLKGDLAQAVKSIMPRGLICVAEKPEEQIFDLAPDGDFPSLDNLRKGLYYKRFIPGPNYIELLNIDLPSDDPDRRNSFQLHCRRDIIH